MLDLIRKLVGSSDIIGIDLGTTNSVVSILESGKAKSILNLEGKRTTPSVVAYTKDGSVLVGDPAARQMITNPANTIFSSKRFIGTSFNERKKEAFTVPYIVRPDQDGRTAFEINGKLIYPEEIGAEVLKKLKEAAEAYLGKSLSKAVITVPAYFNESQRQSTIDAAKLAGLTVVATINEPTAAALAHAQELKAGQTIAVYDLGGGTYDFTILKATDEGLEVKGTGGNSHLGGDNFDELIISDLVSTFMKEEGKDLTKFPEAMARLKEAASKAKMELSTVQSTDINLPFLVADESKPYHLSKSFSRAEFEKMIGSLVDQTLELMPPVIENAGLSKGDIDQVILVGGSTRIPLVRNKVEAFFSRAPHANLEIDEIVSHGAAFLGASKKGDVKINLQDVTSLNLGIEIIGDRASVIIPANTPVPVELKRLYKTTEDDQTAVDIDVVQGMSDKASENKKLKTFVLEGLPAKPRGDVKITVTFAMDSDGILTVTAVDQDGKPTKVKIANAASLSQVELKEREKEINLAPEKKKDLNKARFELNEGIKEAKAKVISGRLEEAEAEKMTLLIEEGKKQIESSSKPKELKAAARKLDEALAKDGEK